MRDQALELYRLLDEHRREEFSALVRRVSVPDAEVIEPGGPQGLEEALAGWVALLDAVDDLTFDTVAITESEGRLVIEHLVHGTHTGPLRTTAGEIPATGRVLRVPAATVLEHEGGLMRRYRFYYDQLALLSQLGVLEAGGGGVVRDR